MNPARMLARHQGPESPEAFFVSSGISGAPVTANATFFDDFNTLNVATFGWNPSGMITPGNGSLAVGGHTWTISSGQIPLMDGVQAGGGSQVVSMWNISGTIWIYVLADVWYFWNGSSWVVGSAQVGPAWIDHYPFFNNEYHLPAVDEQEMMIASQPGYFASTAYQPFSISNSILSIKAQSVISSGIANAEGQPWNGGNITSCHYINNGPSPGLLDFQYGYIESRCRWPDGGPTNSPGYWPQLVLYPLSGVGPAELDIFEGVSGSVTVVRQTVHSTSGTTFFSPTASMDTGFHRIGVDWQADFITFYVDGIQTGQIPTPSDLKQRMYINCGLAVAGPNSWQGTPFNTNPADPGIFQVDYIGVWPSFTAAYPPVSQVGSIVWASRTMLQPTTRTFNQWSLTAGRQISLNGHIDPITQNVIALVYHSHTLFQENSTPDWWYWNTTTSDGSPGTQGWVYFNLLGPISLSTTSYPAGAVAGTAIATVSVPMSTNAAGDTFPGVWGGTLTLGGTDAASFAISGSTLSVAPGHTLSNAQYNITISAQVPVGIFNVGKQLAATAFQLNQVGQVESVEGFSVNTSGPITFASQTMLVASNGPFNQFAFNSSFQVTLNGVVIPSSAGVTLVYHNHTSFVVNSSNQWFYWNTSTSDLSPGTPGYVLFNLAGPITLNTLNYPAGATAGTTIATISVPMSANAAADTFPGPWGGTLTLAGADAVNFVISGSNLNVAAGRTLSNTGQTYNITISAQVPSGGFNLGRQLGPTAFALTQQAITGVTLSNSSFVGGSPSGTVVGNVSVTMSSGSFTGQLTVTGADASSFQSPIVGGQLKTNGVVASGTYNINIVATQAGAGGSPFTQPETIAGTAGSVTITGITLSSSTFAGGSASGATIGTIAVVTSGGSFTGSLSLTGTNASSFQIVGSNLQTNGVVATGTYSLNIVATQAGAVGSPFTQPETLTATASFFVATNGNDTWSGTLAAPNAGNTDGPFRTITRAQTVMRGSGTKIVRIRGGTYTLAATLTFSSSDNGCKYGAYQTEQPIIDGATTFGLNAGGITTAGGGLTIQGLTFQRMSPVTNNFCVFFQGTGYTVRWNTITNFNGWGFGGTMSNSLFDSNTATGQGTAGTAAMGGFFGASGNTFSHNLIQNCQGMGIDINTAQTNGDPPIHDNIYDRNLLQNTCLSQSDGGALYMMNRGATQAALVGTISNNVVINGGPGITDNNKCIYLDDNTSNVVISGNLIYGSSNQYKVMYHGGAGNAVTNNIFVCPPGAITGFYQNLAGDAGMAGNSYQHNIVYWITTCRNPQWSVAGTLETPPTVSNNLYFSGNGSQIFNTNPFVDTAPVFADPQFVNAAGNDFRLQPTSPAYTQLGWTTLPTDQGPLPYVIL